MPAPSWSSINSVVNPLPAWRFFVTFPSAPSSSTGTSSTDASTLAFLVEQISCPLGTIEVEQVPFAAGARAFPTGRSIDSLTIILMEDTKLSVLQYLWQWSQAIVDTQGNFALPSTYKKAISLQPYDETNNSVGTITWGSAFITHVAGFDMNGATSTHVSLQTMFAVDTGDFTITAGGGQ